MTEIPDLHAALVDAIQAELVARRAGSEEMQQMAMQTIRQLRQALVLQANGDLDRALEQTALTPMEIKTGGEGK
jgi:hypothetical protein